MCATTALKSAVVETSSEDESTERPEPSVVNANGNGIERMEDRKAFQSLKDRSRVPLGFYGIAFVFGCAHYASGFWSRKTMEGWLEAMSDAAYAYKGSFEYLKDLSEAAFYGQITDWKEFCYAVALTFTVGCIFYVLVGAPLMAGFWTGRRATRHLVHRYMGLLFLTQYAAAWINYVTDYEKSINSILPHVIGINGKFNRKVRSFFLVDHQAENQTFIGIIQGMSAYFSFRVLPELQDPGYYSDKAVVSRNFVHENVFFSALTTLGSVYYNDEFRTSLGTCLPGQLVEMMFVFFPYVTLRPLFPVTSFSDAGKNKKGRTDHNTLFYQIGTKMIKYFYLWAKYFLGFYINFLVYLNKLTDSEWYTLRGMLSVRWSYGVQQDSYLTLHQQACIC